MQIGSASGVTNAELQKLMSLAANGQSRPTGQDRPPIGADPANGAEPPTPALSSDLFGSDTMTALLTAQESSSAAAPATTAKPPSLSDPSVALKPAGHGRHHHGHAPSSTASSDPAQDLITTLQGDDATSQTASAASPLDSNGDGIVSAQEQAQGLEFQASNLLDPTKPAKA